MVSSRTKQGIAVLTGSMLVHITLGVLYCFGNISPYIVSYLRDRTKDTEIRYANISWCLTLMVVGQGSTMVVGGLLEKKIGPRLTVMLGCSIVCTAMALTYFSINSFYTLICTYGLMFGCGIGTAYTPALANSMRWLPKYQGVVAGVVVGGFGLGALVFNPVISIFINPNNTSPTYAPYKNKPNETYFSDATGDKALLDRVPYCFLFLGACFVVLQSIGCLLIRASPPDEMKRQLIPDDPDSEPLIEDSGPSQQGAVEHLSPRQIICTRDFWCLWFGFLFNIQGIQYCSAYWKAFGQTFISNDLFLAGIGSVGALFNAFSRVMWGYLGDKISFKPVMMACQGLFIVLYGTMYYSKEGGQYAYAAVICMLFLCIGGSFSLYPTVISKLYGSSYGAANYGTLCTSSIAGAVFSSLMLSHFVPILTAQHMQWVVMAMLLGGFTSTGLFKLRLPCIKERTDNLPHYD